MDRHVHHRTERPAPDDGGWATEEKRRVERWASNRVVEIESARLGYFCRGLPWTHC